MKTAHRKAARAKAARKYELFDPWDDPAWGNRAKQRAQEIAPTAKWQREWQPLEPTPAPPRRAGADDFERIPSLVAGQRVAYQKGARK